MQIHGLNKMTLLDYPKHLAALLFLGGCNMRCPFCQNASLVVDPKSQPVISEDELFSYLNKRKNILEGVCISGGEPTLHPDLPQLIERIKALGYLVKLDTNGTNSAMIKQLVRDHLIDYVAMDIKNSMEKYSETSGTPENLLVSVEESVAYLKASPVEHEFRTTIVRELHTTADIISIGKWLKGSKLYYLQSYRDSEDILYPGYHAHSRETLEEFVSLLTPYIEHVQLRGAD
jgi:pyruvate formate lyase activating enzyme